MRRTRTLAFGAAIVTLVSISTWLFAAEREGPMPPGDYEAAPLPRWPLTEANAKTLRDDALRRAEIFAYAGRVPRSGPADPDPLECRFLRDDPTGTSAKFNCVLPGGDVIKVKYGRNAEIHAEVAASNLLSALGFPADDVQIVPRLRCYGCPRYPFLAMQLLWLTKTTQLLAPYGHDNAFTDFDWVAVERKFPAPAIETDDVKGWGWWELERSHAPRADVDALRLAAIFLAHWDNKTENQRLVCLDPIPGTPDVPCEQPVAIIQDVGSTFGPVKMNVARWGDLPIWADRQTCAVSMRALPFGGGTFPDTQISEGGRLQAVRLFASLDEEAVRRIFTEARFPDFYSPTDDERDLDTWVAAFKHRVEQLSMAGPCP